MSLLPTGSKLELAETCVASAVYEGINEETDASELGTEKHRFHVDVLELGRTEALARAPEKHRAALGRFNTEALPAGQKGKWAGEVTFGLDIETGAARELGRNLGRSYAGAAKTEVVGTIDVLGMTPTRDAMIVVDLKTGFTRVTRAKGNLQLLFAAVCAAKVYGTEKAQGAILYADEDGEPYWDSAEWDTFDLVAAEGRIINIAKRVIEARRAWYEPNPDTGEVLKPRLVVGKHCRFCPVLTTCPAQGALARRFVKSETETEEDLRKGLSDNDAAALLFHRLVALKACVEKVLAIVYARAAKSPIVLGNGMVLGEVEGTRDSIDGKVVADVVREMYGPQAVEEAVAMDASKASLKRFARTLKETEGGTIKGRVEEILAEVSRRGGVVSKPTKMVKEYRAQLPKGETP